MKKRSIEQIKQKIKSEEANIFTAQEIKDLIKNDDTPSFEEVDVITCGTCGVMSGTAAIFNLIASEPGVFKRAKNIYLNGVPGTVGPCPNEWLGSVDLILNGTSHSIYDEKYGGGFLFKDLVKGEEIDIEVETINGDIIKSETSLDEMPKAQMIGSRMAFKNYTAFTNSSKEEVSSIFSAKPLIGSLKGLTFSGCGDINPLQNDPFFNYIKTGTKILLNGASGIVLGEGTRSSKEKPNLMLSGNMKDMDENFLGGFLTGEGPEVFDTVSIPIPILNEEIYKNILILNKNIPLTVADIKGRHLALAETDYGAMWDGHDMRPLFSEDKCLKCEICNVENVCPTYAFSNYNINLKTCYGCGMCTIECKNNAFTMDLGEVDLDINNKKVNIPIICRQSDKLRGNRLSKKLKKMIINHEFQL